MAETREGKSGEKPRSASGLLLGGLLLALVAILISGLLYTFVGLEEAQRLALHGWEQLQAAPPIAFFSVVLIASLLPIPVSVLYAAAGTLYGVTTTLLWIAATAMLANLIVYATCSSFLRPTLIRQIEKRGHTIPKLESRSDETLLITLVRITPGFPYFLQNWLLGLAGVEIIRFLGITLVIHMLYASGFVILGRSAFEGELGMVAIAIALLVVISAIARIVHKRAQASRNNTPRDSTGQHIT
ncbi:MAG: TVP38/TMEM64 family protein [Myxococcota bacterium]